MISRSPLLREYVCRNSLILDCAFWDDKCCYFLSFSESSVIHSESVDSRNHKIFNYKILLPPWLEQRTW